MLLADKPRRVRAASEPHGREERACGWYRLAGSPANPRRAEGALSFDHVVIGAGFTGLACARRLAELDPDASVALVEADRVAAGNSGRNSGFLLDVAFYDDAGSGIQAARTRLQRGGLAELTRVVLSEGIDCDWQPFGNLYGAISQGEDRHLSLLADKYRGYGEALENWSTEKMADITGSTRFRRALFHPGTVLAQPVKLVRGLAEALPANVTLFEESPVLSVSQSLGAVEIRTEESQIRAGRAFVCANGGAPQLGAGKGRALKVWTFAAMTGPLDPSHWGVAGVAPFGLLPCFTGGPTLRKTRDGRLLVRQGFAPVSGERPRARDLRRFLRGARKTLAYYWPDLVDLAFDYVWEGAMVLTWNCAQVFGQAGSGLYAAAFCNGAGNCSGTMAGKLLAELGLGQKSALLADQQSLPQPRRLPPGMITRLIAKQRIAKASRQLAACQDLGT